MRIEVFVTFGVMLDIRQVSYSYNDKPAVSEVSFTAERGQHISIIGESGSGKSTLLKLLFGMYDLDSGEIVYDGTPVLGPKFNLIPGMEGFQYLAQDFGLMPFISAAENVGKFLSNIDKKKKRERVDELLEVVEMSDFADVHVKNLSGGQQQRIALAKALAPVPELLLLDEPFSQIDVFRSNTLRRKVYSYLKENKITCITATHDSDDVLSFSDLVIVMKDGKVVDSGRPKEIYRNPTSYYVASLFGDVNDVPRYLLAPATDREETMLLYPYMLRAVDHLGLRVVVENSYFRGTHYLIEAKYSHGVIYFEHPVPFEKKTGVFLGLKKT